MTQYSPEGNYNFGGDTLVKNHVDTDSISKPTTDEIIIKSTDSVEAPQTGPIDRSNLGRPLLDKQAGGLAAVALENPRRLGGEIKKFVEHAQVAVDDEALNLGELYPDLEPVVRPYAFANDALEAALEQTDEEVLVTAGVLRTSFDEQEAEFAAKVESIEQERVVEVQELRAEVKKLERLLIREKATELEILRTVRATDVPEKVVSQIEDMVRVGDETLIANLISEEVDKEVARQTSEKPSLGEKVKSFITKSLAGTAMKASGSGPRPTIHPVVE